MPLDRFVLILVIVLAAALATVWVAAWVSASLATSWGWLLAPLVAAVAYVAWRVVSDRLRASDDPYDRQDP